MSVPPGSCCKTWVVRLTGDSPHWLAVTSTRGPNAVGSPLASIAVIAAMPNGSLPPRSEIRKPKPVRSAFGTANSPSEI